METNKIYKDMPVKAMAWILMCISFLVAVAIPYLIFPMSETIIKSTPPHGFIASPFDMIFNAVVNGTIVFWIIFRSVFKGYKLYFRIFLTVFLVQTFQTQIETAYFINAFPLLKGNFEIYMLITRGALEALIFAGLALLISGMLKISNKKQTSFIAGTERIVKISLWLSAIYILLYMVFGYYVAWQSQELRMFYGGPEKLNTFFGQWQNTLMDKPELPFFQYCRGFLWIVCLIPVFKSFTGGKKELILLSALLLGLLPTAQLAFANPLMPSGVSQYHFFEVTISNGIFGAIAGWTIPVKNPSV